MWWGSCHIALIPRGFFRRFTHSGGRETAVGEKGGTAVASGRLKARAHLYCSTPAGMLARDQGGVHGVDSGLVRRDDGCKRGLGAPPAGDRIDWCARDGTVRAWLVLPYSLCPAMKHVRTLGEVAQRIQVYHNKLHWLCIDNSSDSDADLLSIPHLKARKGTQQLRPITSRQIPVCILHSRTSSFTCTCARPMASLCASPAESSPLPHRPSPPLPRKKRSLSPRRGRSCAALSPGTKLMGLDGVGSRGEKL